ncbi:SDR family oxidoreductase [Paenibacillus nasutitermitis]|uniref:2-deoxy-D-gluconate 3-dehydrogenase n=1 Tax=Paenibacillus nasutitermitis TaxID=1652958 RepID=A0A916Z896_9BACL|nr:SDR family oxidoreductase [Paenibacillus nasutitermitis]GGD79962.1 2-deoxy-D-gluconate 3-dehydrogenase [Paenibacillus nasutitermitis]
MRTDLFDLSGKKAIVTGGGRNLGKGIAEGLHLAGAEVVLMDISEDISSVAAEMGKEGARVSGVQVDLLDRGQLNRAFEEAVGNLGGRVDILFNNAGIHDRRACLDLPVEAWDRVLELNLTTVYQLCQLAGRRMIAQGSGKIINTGSMLSFIGGFNATAYAASKGAIAQLTKSLSNEWAGSGIQVNAIAPGYMDTDMNSDLKKDSVRYPQVTARIPAGRWGTQQDLHGIAIFLASQASNYITGTVIPVDGGYLVR